MRPSAAGWRWCPAWSRTGRAGEVLAVPESAVIDTGKRTVVYVERMPGMFDGVEVVLGPRCGGIYPVVRGWNRASKSWSPRAPSSSTPRRG